MVALLLATTFLAGSGYAIRTSISPGCADQRRSCSARKANMCLAVSRYDKDAGEYRTIAEVHYEETW